MSGRASLRAWQDTAHVPELEAWRVAARSLATPEVELISTREQRRAAWQLVAASARHDLLEVSAQVDGVFLVSSGDVETRHAAGVSRRLVVPSAGAGTRELLGLMSCPSLRVAVHAAAPDVAASVADESVAVITTGATPGADAVLVRAPALVRLIRRWAEDLWTTAAPLDHAESPAQSAHRRPDPAQPPHGHPDPAHPDATRPPHGRPDPAHPDATQPPHGHPSPARPTHGHPPHGRPDAAACRLLDLLGVGMKDDAIARSLGISARTVRRRVAELQARFGAANRLQLVAQAAVQGWIEV